MQNEDIASGQDKNSFLLTFSFSRESIFQKKWVMFSTSSVQWSWRKSGMTVILQLSATVLWQSKLVLEKLSKHTLSASESDGHVETGSALTRLSFLLPVRHIYVKLCPLFLWNHEDLTILSFGKVGVWFSDEYIPSYFTAVGHIFDQLKKARQLYRASHWKHDKVSPRSAWPSLRLQIWLLSIITKSHSSCSR